MAAKFELYEDSAGWWRWRLKAANGVKIASSGESFDSKSNARRAAETVKATAPNAEIESASLSSAEARAAALKILLG